MSGYTSHSYTAIIGDVRDSKNLSGRENIQNKFKEVLDKINEDYKCDIASAFSIAMGDELQGLLKSNEHLLAIIFEIELKMSPVEFRFGVGFGDISTDLDSTNSLLNDGPAYHRARQMVEFIETNEKKYGKADYNILFCSDQSTTPIDQLINAALSLATVIKSKWTDRQKEIISSYLANEKNQYQTAESLGIGQSTVSKALSNTHYYSFRQTYDSIQMYINEQGSD